VFELEVLGPDRVRLKGRFDATQAPRVGAFLETLEGSCVIECADLEYISSAGLGVLLAAYKRLSAEGGTIRLVGMRKLVRDVFRYSRMDTIFEVE
jgi:anti-sigma B factor antagonist